MAHYAQVRLGAAVHSRDEAAAAQLAEGIKSAMKLQVVELNLNADINSVAQGAKFDAALNHQVIVLAISRLNDGSVLSVCLVVGAAVEASPHYGRSAKAPRAEATNAGGRIGSLSLLIGH